MPVFSTSGNETHRYKLIRSKQSNQRGHKPLLPWRRQKGQSNFIRKITSKSSLDTDEDNKIVDDSRSPHLSVQDGNRRRGDRRYLWRAAALPQTLANPWLLLMEAL